MESILFRALRGLARDDAAKLLKQTFKGVAGAPLRPILDALYSTPLVSVEDLQVKHEVEKARGNSIGKLKVSLGIQRGNRQQGNVEEAGSMSLVLLLGSFNSRSLLAHTVIQLSRTGKWSVEKELEFDWSIANADGGGEGGGSMILRLLLEEVRGLDTEVVVRLN